MKIDEFAKLANVAKSSVSKALNGKTGVSEETRQRIISLAKQYNFQPNQAAQALAKNKTNCIAFVLPQEASASISSDYWTGIMTTVAELASLKNYSLMIVTPPSSQDDLSKLLNPLIRRHAFDGLIIGAEQLSPQILSLIEDEKLSFVFIGTNPDIDYFSIGVDSRNGAKNLVKELIKNGAKNIGCFSGPEEYLYNIDRVFGFREAVKESNLTLNEVTFSSYKQDKVYENAINYFRKYTNLDSLFISAGGSFALRILKAMKEVYKDISKIKFAIFDYTPYFDITDLFIITAKQPLKEIGQKSFETLIQLMNNQTPQKKMNLLNVEIFKH